MYTFSLSTYRKHKTSSGYCDRSSIIKLHLPEIEGATKGGSRAGVTVNPN